MAICSNCGYYSQIAMRFCGNCGARLAESAEVYGVGFDLGLEINGQFLQDQPASTDNVPMIGQLHKVEPHPGGQRREVAVLFADLTGYTSLSAKLDNEEVYDLLQLFVKILINEVNKYEGYVDKLTGDGLMALFGAPISYENNAERAIRSALGMQTGLSELNQQLKQQIGNELQMRVGIHTGSVIVGSIGSGQIMEYTAIGDTVNLARRIEESAAPGRIWVSEAAYRLTYRLFEYQSFPGLQLKGILEPVTAYQVSGLKTKHDTMRGLEGLRAPLIGREDELYKLTELLNNFKINHRGHLIILTGEAGIGKSRLTAEIKSRISPDAARILEASSLTYRRSVSFWVFLDLLRGYYDIRSAKSDHENTQKITTKTQAVLGEQAGRVLPYLEHFLSVRPSDESAFDRIRYLDPGQLRQQIFLAIRDLIEAECKNQPLIIILEDLHWADDASLELLAFLLDLVSQVPIFFYLISRPFQGGALNKIFDWAGVHIPGQFTAIRLQVLSEAQSTNLLNTLLTIPDLPEGFQHAILKRSSGIPFYIEEILRTLIDKGYLRRQDDQWHAEQDMSLADIGIPETLQGLILARFDRLTAFQRQILQIASVIGHQFRVDILKHLLPEETAQDLEAALSILVQKEYLAQIASFPEQEYAFHHVLMSEAIYQTILKRERANLHGQVGEAIESIYRENINEQIELLARHYSWSNRSDRALHYLILAGQKAAAGYMNEQAQQHYQQAQFLLPKVAHALDQRLQILQGLGDVLTIVGDYHSSREHYQAALAAIDQEPEQAHFLKKSILHRKIARSYERQGTYDSALRHLKLAHLAIPEHTPDFAVEDAQTLNDIGWIYFRQGKFSEAEKLLKNALELVENSTALDAVSSIYNRLGGITYNKGDWDRTADYLRKSISIRDSIGDVVGLANSLNNLGLLEIEMGELSSALRNLDRSYALKKHLGQAEGVGTTLNNLGWLRIQLGESEQAHQNLTDALNLAHKIGYNLLEGQALKNLGELYIEIQQWLDATITLRKAIEIFKLLGAHDQLIDSYRLLGEASLGLGEISLGQECINLIEEMAVPGGGGSRELSSIQRNEYMRFRGMLAAHSGEWEFANRCLTECENAFKSLGARLYQGKAVMQLGLLAEAQGDMYTAQHRFREAELLFRSVGARSAENRARTSALRQVA